MSETISLKLGVKFAVSLNMGKNVCSVLYIITYKDGEIELQSIVRGDVHIPSRWLQPNGLENVWY